MGYFGYVALASLGFNFKWLTVDSLVCYSIEGLYV